MNNFFRILKLICDLFATIEMNLKIHKCKKDFQVKIETKKTLPISNPGKSKNKRLFLNLCCELFETQKLIEARILLIFKVKKHMLTHMAMFMGGSGNA